MNVALRPFRIDDAPQVREWRNAPHVAPHMYSDHEIGETEHARWAQAAITKADRRYWIILMDERPVGLANLARIDIVNRRCDWAYYLGETETRGKGVGACVEYMVLHEVFGPMGLNKLTCEVFAENESVVRLHESFGFTREANLRDHVWKGGRFRNVWGMGMLASDWARAHRGVEDRLFQKGIDPSKLEVRVA